MQMAKYKFDYNYMKECDEYFILGRIDAICDYVNAVNVVGPSTDVILAMLKIEKIEEGSENNVKNT